MAQNGYLGMTAIDQNNIHEEIRVDCIPSTIIKCKDWNAQYCNLRVILYGLETILREEYGFRMLKKNVISETEMDKHYSTHRKDENCIQNCVIEK